MARAIPQLQQTLFGGGPPGVGTLAGARRIELDHGAWVEHLPAWVSGQDALMAALVTTTSWREERRKMYDRVVPVPRLVASLPEDGPGHPLLLQIGQLLRDRYGVAFPRVSLGYYRSGADSVAWHGDTIARELPEALVARCHSAARAVFSCGRRREASRQDHRSPSRSASATCW